MKQFGHKVRLDGTLATTSFKNALSCEGGIVVEESRVVFTGTLAVWDATTYPAIWLPIRHEILRQGRDHKPSTTSERTRP